MKERSWDLHDDFRWPTWLNLSGATKKPSFARVTSTYVFLVTFFFLKW